MAFEQCIMEGENDPWKGERVKDTAVGYTEVAV